MTDKKEKTSAPQAERMQVLTAVLVSVVTVLLTVMFLISPKQSFSENENRVLAKLPEFTPKSLKDGSFTNGLNRYLSDHFPFRDLFMTLKCETEIRLGRKEINGVFIGKDGYYIDEYRTPKNTANIAAHFTKLKENVTTDARVFLMLVPASSAVCADRLPPLAPPQKQMDTLKEIYAAADAAGIHTIDCFGPLTQAAEDAARAGGGKAAEDAAYAGGGKAAGGDEKALYYRTDHHWTTFGAWVGYTAYCQAAGITPLPLEAFTEEIVTEDFRGTTFSRLNDLLIPGDRITLRDHSESRLTVTYENGKVTDTLYNREYLEKKDKYSMFLDNMHPLIVIENANADSGRCLALVKDSYANCLVPYLVNHYQSIYVFDTRYYREGPSALINAHPEITDVLILYNMYTMDEDIGINGIY